MFLNCHTYFSFLYGTLSSEELIGQAKAIGLERLVLTDINNTSACIEASRIADNDVDVILGIDFRNDTKQQFVGISKNEKGFEELNRLLSSYLKNKDEIPAICPELQHCYVIYPFYPDKEIEPLESYEFLGIKADDLHYLKLQKWQSRLHKIVILHTVSFKEKKDIKLHEVLRCVDANTILSKKPFINASENDVFLNENDFYDVYADYQILLNNTAKLLYSCESIDFDFGNHKNKAVVDTHQNKNQALRADFEQLKKLTYEGAAKRYSVIDDPIKNRIEKELKLIKSQKYVSYFLINHNIISFAQSQGFYYIGRGSGVNSIVAYCLQITDVEPLGLDLYFERFMNLYRKNPPDFDIDFSWQDRDKVIQFIFETYGLEHTCLQATYTTFQTNSIFRELGKVYGLPVTEIEELTHNFRENTLQGLDEWQKEIVEFEKRLRDFPRNLSIHAGGILISDKPIYNYTATSHPPKGFPISQFDMHAAEDLGLYKFDILSQRGLGHIKDTLAIVKENRGIEIDIHDISRFMTDQQIVSHLEKGNLMGCFYVESPAMRMLLAKLQCKDYLTLVAASSIIRPGVAQSGMMREYVSRHHMPDKGKAVADKIMWNLMEDTYGVMVYQEDVIKVAHKFAQLDLGESDILRRGMSGKYRSREEFQKVKEKFFTNCQNLGYKFELSAEVWRQIESFAGYSFAKGHSASFAVESYQSMFLKAHFPLDFMVGVINNFGGFYHTECYVQEAKRGGAQVELPCVNESDYFTKITGNTIYLGFKHISSLESKITEVLLKQREIALFESLDNFIERVGISLEQVIILIRIGAFRFTGKTKQALLWDAHFLLNKQPKPTIHAKLFKSIKPQEFSVPQLHHDYRNDMLDELEILGFTLNPPFDLIEEKLPENLILANDIPSYKNQHVNLVGQLIVTKQAKTKNGIKMYFATFLDRQGKWIDTVLFPDVAARYKFKGLGCYLISGKVTEEFNFFTVEVSYMRKLKWWNAQSD